MSFDYLTGLHLNYKFLKSNVELPLWFTVLGWVITIINIIANSVLLLVIKRSFMDNSQYWFTFSLATADLLIGVSIFPSIFFCSLTGTNRCDWYIQPFVYTSFIYVSVSSVTTTIFGHYITMTFPLRYATLMSSPRVWKIIVLSWVTPVALALLPLSRGRVQEDDAFEAAERYHVSLIVIFEIIPFCIFLWISIHLVKIVKSQKNKIQAQCNVQGRLSPPAMPKCFDTKASCTVVKCIHDVTDISTNQDSAFSISKSEISEGINPGPECYPQVTEATRNQTGITKETNQKPSYLYTLNNWLPSLAVKPMQERAILDTIDFSTSTSVTNNSQDAHSSRFRIKQFRDQRHRTILLSCLLFVFLMCYILTLANASCSFSNHCIGFFRSSDFKIVTLFFELLNSTLNPLLFILLGKDLRRKVIKLFLCKK